MAQDHEESLSMAESLPDAPAETPTKQSYRSFKKKYAKLKVQFELGMRESEKVIREELRIEDLSKRIQEQNDQLLEVLLEFNDSLHISPKLRYDLSAPGDESFLPTPRELSPAYNDPVTAKSALTQAREGMAAGQILPEQYQGLEEAIKRGKAFAPEMQYTSLTKVPHGGAQDQNTEGLAGNALGYLTPEHETEYYSTVDAKLGDESAALQLSRISDKPSFADRERDAFLRSSVSVYNWLRRNQPHIFLQDNENASEKSGSRPSNLRTSKRASTNQPKKEEDTYDEDSILESGPTPGGTKNKRKRDEDTGYRPKGGSSRSRKKKEDGGTSTKRGSKRSSGVGA